MAEDEIRQVEAEVEEQVASAIQFAEASPEPLPEEAFQDVFA
jgi:TPP-dependent pyruvate/acetoin dehydrogenase alpha subunit